MSLLLAYGGACLLATAIVLAYATGVRDGRAMNAGLLASMKADLEIAHDRLYAAWKDGAVVPPRPVEPAGSGYEAPLPRLLQELVDQWESAEGRRSQEAVFRAKLLTGMTPEAIFREHENSVALS